MRTNPGFLLLVPLLCLLLVPDTTAQEDEEEEEECPEYECPSKDGSFADPCTCRRYYACIDFNPVHQVCPSGLYWDDVKKYCTYKREAICGPVASTPAPPTTPPPPDTTKKCEPSECVLPWCYCSSNGTAIPGGLLPEETPQMVLIMIDGAVNQGNFPTYKRLFKGRKSSSNGCKVLGTFFLTHHYGDYANVESLRHDGHEVGVSSISDDKSLYLKNKTAWVNELVGMRKILEIQARVEPDSVLGVRAPGLTPGYNAQYEALIDYGFIWDSSIGVPPLEVPVWPYTLDYKIPHKCRSASCPTRQFPGVWEIPMNSHYIEGYIAGHCPYLDQCVFTHMETEDIFQWLKEDFNRHYKSNKAPYNLAIHTNWFQTEEQRDALSNFLDWLQEKEDVYFVTGTQALLWMTEPTPLNQISQLEAWKCKTKEELPPKPCRRPNSCSLTHKVDGVNQVRYMTTCRDCPNRYPWIGNTRGRDTDEKDVYEPFTEE